MVQSPSWAPNWFAASQEIPRISRNPKFHYRTHKRPPPVSILGQPNPVHIHTSHLLEIHPNIIHPSTPRSSQWPLSLRFPHQDPIHPLSSPIRATCPPISFFSILSPAQYWVRSTHHLALRQTLIVKKIEYFLWLFHGNSGYANASQCYRILRCLFLCPSENHRELIYRNLGT